MHINKTIEEAVKNNDLKTIYSSLYTILLSDPGFSTSKFDDAMKYVKNNEIDGFIQKHNGVIFEAEEKWSEEYWDKVASELIDNFSMERINHLKDISKKLYPNKEDDLNIEQKKTQEQSSSKSLNKKTGTVGIILAIIIVLIILYVLMK
jgi:predicted metalloprotease